MITRLKQFVAGFALAAVAFLSGPTLAASLPEGYAELKWIQSSGTQWIDTGVPATVNTRIEASFNTMTRTENWADFFGAITDDKPNNGVALRYYNNTTRLNAFFCNTSNKETQTPEDVDMSNTDVQVVLQKNKLTVNGSDYPITTTNTPCKYNIVIFGESNDGRFRRGQAMKLYSFKMSEVDGDAVTAVRDFVPCRNEKGEAGLWDCVEGKFHENKGTGRFAGSDDADVYLSSIQSSGTQWIDTGVLPTYDMKAELDMRFDGKVSGDYCMFGVNNIANGIRFQMYCYLNAFHCRIGTYDNGDSLQIVAHNNRTLHTLEMDGVNATYTCGDASKSVALGTTATEKASAYLFTTRRYVSDSEAPGIICSATFYGGKIWVNETLVRDFVPVRRADGVIGLADLANGGEFYANKGSGVFTWGGIAYNIDGTTLKLHEGTLAAADLADCTAVEKVDWYELNAGAVTSYTVPLTLSKGVFALTDGEVKKVTVGGKLTINGGVTLKIDAANGACDNFEAQSLDLSGATEDNPIVIEVNSAVGMDWSAGVALIANAGLADGPCANIRIAENDELQPVVKDGDLMICMKSSAAHWTGEVGDNDPTNPDNWQERVVPNAETIVYFSGESVPDIPVGTPFAAKSLELNATLVGNHDWRGLNPDIPVTGRIDLNGHSLTVADLTGGYEITDSSAVVYERLEYIQSSGTQWIDTGVYDADAMKTEGGGFEAVADVSFNDASSEHEILAARLNGSNRYFLLSANGGKVRNSYGDHINYGDESAYTANKKYHIESVLHNGKQSLKVTEGSTTLVDKVGGTSTKQIDMGGSLYLFAVNAIDQHAAKWFAQARLYSCKITRDDFATILRDFVPVRRVSDGAIGLLDLAHLGTEDEFYANKGSDTFTAGATTGYILTKPGCGEQAVPGELHVNVAGGKTVENATVAISGALKFVKDGEGAFAVKIAQTYAGGTEVKDGTLACVDNVYPGALPMPVTVYEGAVFDVGFLHKWNAGIVLAGGTLANTQTDYAPGGGLAQNAIIAVASNSTVVVERSFGIANEGSGASVLDLGGKELAISIAAGKTFWIRNADVTAGTLKTTGAGALQIDATSMRAAAADFDLGCGAVSIEVPTEVHDLTVRRGTTVGGNGTISVNGAYRPLGATASKVAMKDGATFDLSTTDTALDLAGTTTTFADNATVTIHVGERELHKDDKVVTWTSAPENVAGLTFKIVGTRILTDDFAQVTADGIYYTVDPDAIMTATWTGAEMDGNVANPGNWACTNAMGREVTGERALPGEKTTVTFEGGDLPDITAGSFTAAKVVASDAVLADDCDWGGLVVPVSGKIDLNGHNLAVSQLVGDFEIADSSATTVYERLEYIQSSGTQWIDTGVLPTYDMKAELDMRFDGKVSGDYCMFGVNNIANGIRFQMYCYQNAFHCRIGTHDNGGSLQIVAHNNRTLHTLEMDGVNATYTCGDASKSVALGKTATEKASAYLFTTRRYVSDSAAPGTICSATFYGGKIWVNETLVRDFVPVRRVSDGAVGLLDLAHLGTEDEFYANKGSGTFAAGATTGHILTKTGCGEQAAPGELHVNVASGTVTGGATLTGTVMLVKDGEGTLMWNGGANSVATTCPVVVTNGVFGFATDADDVFGNGGTITIAGKGQMDISKKSKNYSKDYSPVYNRTFYIEGDGPDGEGAIVRNASVSIWGYHLKVVNLTDDATIGGVSYIDIRGTGFRLNGAGYTLTVKNTGRLCIEDSDQGAVEVKRVVVTSKGRFEPDDGNGLAALQIAECIELTNGGRLTSWNRFSSSYTLDIPVTVGAGGGTIGTSQGSLKITAPVTVLADSTATVSETVTFTDLEMQDGATLNVTGTANITGALSGSGTVSGVNVKFDGDATRWAMAADGSGWTSKVTLTDVNANALAALKAIDVTYAGTGSKTLAIAPALGLTEATLPALTARTPDGRPVKKASLEIKNGTLYLHVGVSLMLLVR